MLSIRPISALSHEEIVRLAREQAEAFLPMEHYFTSVQAMIFERAYWLRWRELEQVEA